MRCQRRSWTVSRERLYMFLIFFVFLVLWTHMKSSVSTLHLICPISLDISQILHVILNVLAITWLLIINLKLLLKHFIIIVLWNVYPLGWLLTHPMSFSIEMSVNIARTCKIKLKSWRFSEKVVASSSKGEIERWRKAFWIWKLKNNLLRCLWVNMNIVTILGSS